MSVDSERKAEILDSAATLFGSSGLRTSLQQVADACGILPGSLYHHFESKEAIFIALVERYQAELDEIAEKAAEEGANPRRPDERIVALGTAIAGVRSAAPRRSLADGLRAAGRCERGDGATGESHARRRSMPPCSRPSRRRGRADTCGVKWTRPCWPTASVRRMLHVGIGVSHRTRGGERMPAIRCRMLLDGLAVRPPDDARLDRSRARRAADEAIRSWDEDDVAEVDDKAAQIRAVARSEFARRGIELTTIRDVAAAAGMSTGAVYRVIESKDNLLPSILWSYVEKVAEGWNRIVGSPSTPVEKLDALLWFNINVVHRFAEEHRIQSLGLQLVAAEEPRSDLDVPRPAAPAQGTGVGRTSRATAPGRAAAPPWTWSPGACSRSS